MKPDPTPVPLPPRPMWQRILAGLGIVAVLAFMVLFTRHALRGMAERYGEAVAAQDAGGDP